MRNDLADVTIIMDRSGSMISCQIEAENGINRLIEEQQQQDGECNFTLAQFDERYAVVYDGVPIKDVQPIKLRPCGMTALADAIGKTINTIGDRLSKIDEKNRPSVVMVVIVTDGQENASREFKVPQVRDMIKHQEEKYNWQFVFLGANAEAFAEGARLGVSCSSSCSYAPRKYGAAMGIVSNKMSALRGQVIVNGEVDKFEFTDDDRVKMSEDD